MHDERRPGKGESISLFSTRNTLGPPAHDAETAQMPTSSALGISHIPTLTPISVTVHDTDSPTPSHPLEKSDSQDRFCKSPTLTPEQTPPSSGGLSRNFSIRSQRLWQDIDGKPVLPLPSPAIPSNPHFNWSQFDTQEDLSAGTPGETSRTSAFFESQSNASSPKPPSSMGMLRSASMRKATDSPENNQRRRQRAVSSPNRGSTKPEFSSWNSLSLQTAPLPATDASVASPSDQECHPENFKPTAGHALLSTEAATSKRAGMSRHVHGPSMNITKDSLHPTVMPERSIPKKRGSFDISEQLLRALDTPSVKEDDAVNIVGPYRVTAKLGTGAFSKVVLAERFQGNPDIIAGCPYTKVALKMIECEPWKCNERMRVSWVREVEVLKHISHPSIVKFITSFRTPIHYTLVLEALDGGELFDILARHHSSISQKEWFVRRIFGELASVVGWMHSNNLVHRDLKLENIMLTRPLFNQNAPPLRPSDLGQIPVVKITDFGLARFVESGTALETRCGSEEYVAPELIIGKSYDGRKTDSWALGVVLYAMLTGVLPFIEPSYHSTALPKQMFLSQSQMDENNTNDRDARMRKAHLLRIAKGQLSWPPGTNDESLDVPNCPAELRLVTPRARHVVSRFLERDATQRAECWDLWQDPWITEGSFGHNNENNGELHGSVMLCVANEKSASGERVPIPLNPRSSSGKKWLTDNAYTCDSDICYLAHSEMQDMA